MPVRDEATDEALASRAARGDNHAFDEITIRYQARIYRLACRLVGHDDAPDVVQEGFLSVYRNLASFRQEARFGTWLYRIVTNAAGCGSAMKDYGELFEADPEWESRARAISQKVRDISQVLVELGESRAIRNPIRSRVVYHDACHLAHGQGVRAEPRALLQAIPGVELLTPVESEICCGSAGIYNLVQPDAASALGARKARHIAALSPDMIATGNPGCTLQIAAAARALGYDWPIVHPIELVDASIRGVDPRRQ